MAVLCDGCLQDPCICETASPELYERMMAPWRAKGLDPSKPLGPQLGLDSVQGLAHMAEHLASQGIMLQPVRIDSNGIVHEEPETVN